jgi:hypothetical protein
MLNGNGKVYKIIRGEAAIEYNLPPKRTTELPQRARIVVSKNYKILSQRYDDEVFAISRGTGSRVPQPE